MLHGKKVVVVMPAYNAERTMEDDASCISFRRSVIYGLGLLMTTIQFVLQRLGLGRFRISAADGQLLAFSSQADSADGQGS